MIQVLIAWVNQVMTILINKVTNFADELSYEVIAENHKILNNQIAYRAIRM